MRINFASGDAVTEYVLGFMPGDYEVEMPVDVEILACGVKDKKIMLFVVSKNKTVPLRMKKFVVSKSNMSLPRKDFQYYFYIGTISRHGLHVFEVV